MSKVEYNGELVSTVILVAAADSKRFTDVAMAGIERVNLNESYNIGSIKEELTNCKSNIDKYCSFINTVKTNYNKSDEKMSDILSKISVPKISRKVKSIK